jgi:hypothetical protein
MISIISIKIINNVIKTKLINNLANKKNNIMFLTNKNK